MEVQVDNDRSSSSSRDLQGSSLHSAPSSTSSVSERRSSRSHSSRPGLEASAQQQISHFKSLLDTLFDNQVSGPKLIRLEREFCAPIGHGGQANVYGVSPEFESKVLDLQHQCDDEKLKYSAWCWTKCVVKHLRTDQPRNNLQHALSEISQLCNRPLRGHRNIVKLLSWGISLDGLEAVNLESLSTPLLILEKAHCDLEEFIRSEDYVTVSYPSLCHLALEIGRGLGAVHSANIVHGDLKLENILIFSATPVADKKWTAKLCDFGLAVSNSGKADYKGTIAWRPPEWYVKSFFGHPLPRPLAPCDIFVYGLVVWAMFIGDHCSPLHNIQGEDIVRYIGQQRFFARARVSVAATFSASSSHVQRPDDNEVRRILLVLREALNDAPDRRDLDPWRYLNHKRYPSLPRVENPPQYTPAYSTDLPAREANPTVANCSIDLRGVVLNILIRPAINSLKDISSSWLKTIWGTITQDPGRLVRDCVSLSTQILTRLQRHQRRQQIYEEWLGFTVESIPRFKDLDPLEILEHPPGGEHYVFDYSARMRSWDSHALSPLDIGQYSYYTLGRLRSHLKWCCWQKCSKGDTSMLQQYLGGGRNFDRSVLAWLCRGEVGQREAQLLNGSRLPILNFGNSFYIQPWTDSMKTDAFLILFESGVDIHPTVVVDRVENTQFMWYLKSLKQPEYSLDVASHFQRIARENTTSAREKYYLTGRIADVDTEEDHEALFDTTTTTTALHDAVAAANYPLVEYLVANAFNVAALDSKRRNALERMSGEPMLSSTSDVNSIRALLEQSQPRRSEENSSLALPLGWEETCYIGGSGRKVWQETSIEGDFDAISFITPETGLYKSDRLTLGRIQGEKQIYRLDPLRFLKKRAVAAKPATKPFFDDEWYRTDVRAVEQPLPFNPLDDERAWIRYPARGLHFVWRTRMTLILLVFTLLSLVARLMRWPQPALYLAIVAVSLFSFGFSPAGLWVGTARVIPDPMSCKTYASNLWTNAPELLIGIFGVVRGETTLAKSSLIGFTLCSALWVFGISLFGVGLRRREFLVQRVLSTMTGLCLLASALVSIVVCFNLTSGNTDTVSRFQHTPIFLSRSVAVACLLLWASWLAFRNRTHKHLFDRDDWDEYTDEGTTHDSAILSPIENFFLASTSLVLLGICADNIVHSLVCQPAFTQSICAYFVIPVTARIWAQYQGVRFTDTGDLEIVVESIIGAMLNIFLFVSPSLVLLGWIIGSPMDIRYSLMEVILIDVAVWTLTVVSRMGVFNYSSGAVLMSLYVMSAVGLYFTL